MEQSQTPELKPTHNIVLIGFMGSGKSTIGRVLRKKIGYKLVDTDHVIEKDTSTSISNLFKNQGEDAFRDMETELLKNMIHQRCNEHIISTGGGMVIREKNRLLLRELGFVVWLTCPPEDILARTSRNSNRPLLQCDDPMAAITRLLDERTPMYEETAHLRINTAGLEFDEVACGILESARYHYGTMS
ncbi:MAG: shikimate kinase [Akkermansiaceae bacterium]